MILFVAIFMERHYEILFQEIDLLAQAEVLIIANFFLSFESVVYENNLK